MEVQWLVTALDNVGYWGPSRRFQQHEETLCTAQISRDPLRFALPYPIGRPQRVEFGVQMRRAHQWPGDEVSVTTTDLGSELIMFQ